MTINVFVHRQNVGSLTEDGRWLWIGAAPEVDEALLLLRSQERGTYLVVSQSPYAYRIYHVEANGDVHPISAQLK